MNQNQTENNNQQQNATSQQEGYLDVFKELGDHYAQCADEAGRKAFYYGIAMAVCGGLLLLLVLSFAFPSVCGL